MKVGNDPFLQTGPEDEEVVDCVHPCPVPGSGAAAVLPCFVDETAGAGAVEVADEIVVDCDAGFDDETAAAVVVDHIVLEVAFLLAEVVEGQGQDHHLFLPCPAAAHGPPCR